MDRRIFHLQSQLFKELQHQWTVVEMAENVNLSARHLQKLFKQETGTPPLTYLQDLRLEKARELLETTFLLLKEIGIQVGMPNDSHFTRDFKKKYGVTPTEYRKRYWEKNQILEQNNKN
jgi:transcriptional regulator GlxA family with amidase domain